MKKLVCCFPLPHYNLNSAHWNFQCFTNFSVINVISISCNNMVSKVLRDLIGSIHHRHGTLAMRHVFIVHQLELNQLIFIWNKRHDCFVITDTLQLVSWLFAPLFRLLSNTFFPVSSLIFPRNLVSGHLWFIFFACEDWLGCYWHQMRISSQWYL